MNKLLLIIRREYLTRVTRRSFILATLLTPLAFAVFFIVVGFIFSYESDEEMVVAVIDEGNILAEKRQMKDEKRLFFKKVSYSLDSARAAVKRKEFVGILQIPPLQNVMDRNQTIYYYTEEQLPLDVQFQIQDKVSRLIRDYKIDQLAFDKEQLDALETRVVLEPEPLEEDGEDASQLTGAISAAIGGIMGFIMYLTIFIYGMMIMRSVMEEKTNRIVEVMISSVKPFQLMLGKIIGVGGVGLTQVAVWAILIPLISFLVNLFFGFNSTMPEIDPSAEIDPEDMETLMALAYTEISNINWWMILPLFIFYFLGGYFLYSSLFAAVGSAMGDDLGEGQSLTIPITIPVILAIYIMMKAIQAPNSSLAVFSSIFPLFAPIVMPARLAFNPPVWEILVSVVVVAATSVFFVWLSGRIYRVGILMYGKKVTFKELFKWMVSRG
jgi:ABC-2 type transport system permease protein